MEKDKFKGDELPLGRMVRHGSSNSMSMPTADVGSVSERAFKTPKRSKLERTSVNVEEALKKSKSQRKKASNPARIRENASFHTPPSVGKEGEKLEEAEVLESFVLGEFGFVSATLPSNEGILDLTERERVYNTLVYVPMQYLRMLFFGLLLCLDSFMSLFTLMPLRALYLGHVSFCKLFGLQRISMMKVFRKAGVMNRKVAADEEEELFSQSLPDYVCDILWSGLIILPCYILLQLKTSEVFHYIHAQEVIKLYLVLTMLEIFDKICGSLSFDCLETLAASCSALVGGKSCRGGEQYTTTRGSTGDLFRTLLDFVFSVFVMCFHCIIIMFEAITFNVVLNSANSSLLALLVSNNFAELKGTVFKNMNVTRLWTLTIQDIVEHFHISICLIFVLIENMLLTNTTLPSYQMLMKCLAILGAEVVVDVIKHSFLGKFQNIKPGVYSEYLKDMCEKAVSSSSLNGYRIIKFNPLVPAALLMRIVVPLLRRTWYRAVLLLSKLKIIVLICAYWALLLGMKIMLGWAIQVIARKYLSYYNKIRKEKNKPWLLSCRKPLEKTL